MLPVSFYIFNMAIRKVKIICVVCILFLLDSAVLEDSRKCASFTDGQSNPLGTSLMVQCFPGSSDSKESSGNGRDQSSIPGSGRSSGKGTGYPFQYFCLENSMDRGAWWAIVHGVAKSQTQLSDYHFHWWSNG